MHTLFHLTACPSLQRALSPIQGGGWVRVGSKVTEPKALMELATFFSKPV